MISRKSNVEGRTSGNESSGGPRGDEGTYGADTDVRHSTFDVQPSEADVQPSDTDVRHSTFDFQLVVSDLRKSFYSPNGERIEVLRGVSFTAKAGEAVAIVGASGAGKSTLLHLLGGIETADHGSMLAGEFAIEHARSPALTRFRLQRVGFVFQFHHLLADLTAAENVSLPLRVNRVPSREAMRRARGMLENVGFDRRAAESPVSLLSGGEQQRVAICRALVTKPALVLADEPTGNLDDAMGAQIAQLLVSYAHDNPALVVIASHNPLVAEKCDRRLVLSAGRLSEPNSI